MNTYEHIPVLLNEVLEYLDPRPGRNIVDATLGGGGYTAAILEKIKPDGRVLAIDLDIDAVENAKGKIQKVKYLTIAQGNFSHIDKIIDHHKFPSPDGIVVDLGLSSYELERRGISFQTEQPLDMRFDRSRQGLDAKFILNNYDKNFLLKIFKEYGEERFSDQIVKKILEARTTAQIHYTTDLYQIIVGALPKPVKHKASDSARRIFQALRIEVNHELENLSDFLPKAFDILNPGGRLVVVSFHSLEDRIVKQFFAGLAKGCVCPPDFPQCICGRSPRGKILTKKPVVPSAEELKTNSRSAPAKLRAIIKL